MKEHISYSEFKDYLMCPKYHKLKWVDEAIPFSENEFSIFGKVIHKIAELQLLEKEVSNTDWSSSFDDLFLNALKEYKRSFKDAILNKDLIAEMRAQGRMLTPIILPNLRNYFGSNFLVLGSEEALMEPINNMKLLFPYKFKGFIDLIIQVDDIVHIVDFKSCSFGWLPRKKSDKMINYQLTLYKYFYAQKHNIPLEKIETHFSLLKRTAKKDNVETFRVTSGPKKISNALAALEKAINGIQEGTCYKNKFSCPNCYSKNLCSLL